MARKASVLKTCPLSSSRSPSSRTHSISRPQTWSVLQFHCPHFCLALLFQCFTCLCWSTVTVEPVSGCQRTVTGPAAQAVCKVFVAQVHFEDWHCFLKFVNGTLKKHGVKFVNGTLKKHSQQIINMESPSYPANCSWLKHLLYKCDVYKQKFFFLGMLLVLHSSRFYFQDIASLEEGGKGM